MCLSGRQTTGNVRTSANLLCRCLAPLCIQKTDSITTLYPHRRWKAVLLLGNALHVECSNRTTLPRSPPPHPSTDKRSQSEGRSNGIVVLGQIAVVQFQEHTYKVQKRFRHPKKPLSSPSAATAPAPCPRSTRPLATHALRRAQKCTSTNTAPGSSWWKGRPNGWIVRSIIVVVESATVVRVLSFSAVTVLPVSIAHVGFPFPLSLPLLSWRRNGFTVIALVHPIPLANLALLFPLSHPGRSLRHVGKVIERGSRAGWVVGSRLRWHAGASQAVGAAHRVCRRRKRRWPGR